MRADVSKRIRTVVSLEQALSPPYATWRFALYAGALAALVDAVEGKRIDVSMLQAAASWLITTLPLLNFRH